MNMTDKYKIRDLILFSMLSILFYLLSINYFPLIVFVIPSLFIVLGIKRGYIFLLLEGLIFILAMGLLKNFYEGLAFGGLFIISSLPFIYSYKKNLSTNKTLLVSTIVFLLLTLLLTFLYSKNGIDLVESIENMLLDSINKNIELLNGVDLGLEIDKLHDYLSSSVKILMALIPSIILVSSIFISLINYYLSFIILNFMGFGTARIDKFEFFKLDKDFLKGVFICMLGCLIFDLIGFKYSLELFLNLSFIFAFLFGLQGVAVVYFFLRKRLRSLGAGIIIFILLIMPLRSMFTLFGLLDQLFNFRFRNIGKGLK